ncbi:MAG: hypothetical protein RPU52_06330 [Candidatus Sedimenticola sp. (ex Thyasira tokunagai)]
METGNEREQDAVALASIFISVLHLQGTTQFAHGFLGNPCLLINHFLITPEAQPEMNANMIPALLFAGK